MNIKIIGKGKNKLRIKFEGEDTTFVDLLRKTLWEEKVDYAAYKKTHPFLDDPELIVETLRKDPTNAVKNAAQKIANQMEEFRKEFTRAFSK